MSFEHLKSNITQYLEDRRKNISDNPRSVNYILLKLDKYVDIIYRELQENFPIGDPGVIRKIEASLSRPQLREIEPMETSVSIKNKLVGIVNELENELREFERKCDDYLTRFDGRAFNRYRNNAITIMERERNFLFDGTCLNSMVIEINEEHRKIERKYSKDTRNIRRIYGFFKREKVINDIKAKVERAFFNKTDEIISEYRKYLVEFLKKYEEKWIAMELGQEPVSTVTDLACVTVSPEVKSEEAAETEPILSEEVSVTVKEMFEVEEEAHSQQSNYGFDSDNLSPVDLEHKGNEDNGEESVCLKDEESTPRKIATISVTYTNSETEVFSLSGIQEGLREELEKLLAKL